MEEDVAFPASFVLMCCTGIGIVFCSEGQDGEAGVFCCCKLDVFEDGVLENIGFSFVCILDVGSVDDVVDMERFIWLSIDEDVEDVDDADGDNGPGGWGFPSGGG